jgi:peptide/nickel transport system substrate-binding protein
MLAEMVARGELPPIEERLPVEPMVLEPIEAVGKYSKTLNVFTLNINPWGDAQESPERPPHLMRMTLDGDIIPEIATGYDAADDHLSFTLYLREGLKWSDGDEFTAADFMFKYHDMDQHEQVETWGIRSEITGVRAIDDYTVVFEFDQSYPNLLLDMIDYRATDWVYWAPEHYLKQWHIEYNEDANAKAKEEGYDTWYEALHYHANFFPAQDMDRPTLDSWQHKEFTTTHKIFERNPYFYIVDTAGQQLPYIDRIISTIVDAETYTLKIISGEADFAIHPLNLENFTLYKENEATGNYVVHQVPGILGGNAAYALNLNHPDPVRREIYQDIRFRRALSLAMDREEINRISFKGLAVPRQATIVSGASYYKPEWGENHPYARFAVDEANRLLDDMGLTERDGDGFRVGSDGETILLIIEYVTGQTGFSVHELVKEYWETVGLKTTRSTPRPVRCWASAGTRYSTTS